MANNFTFSENQFNRIFPFYILLTQNLIVESNGTLLEQIFPGTIGKLFSEKFTISAPSNLDINFQNLKSNTNNILIIECLNDEHTKLKGQLDYLSETNQLLFIGSLFNELSEIEINNVSLNDKNSELKTTQFQNDQLNLIVQQIDKAVIITNINNEIEWVNNAFEKLTGYLLEEIKGKYPAGIMNGEKTDPKILKYIVRQIHKSRPFSCEVSRYKKSQESFWVRISAQPIIDKEGKASHYFSIWEDITFEKESHKKLQGAVNRMSSLITNLQSGILLVNELQKIDLVNSRFCEIFSIEDTPANLIGLESTITIDKAKLFFKNPESFVSNIDLYKNEKKLVSGEILEMVDGRIFERDFIPIWNDEKFNGNLWVYTDITEKINFDKKLDVQKIFYEEILDNIPADIAVFDNQHHYLFVNPKGIKDESIRKWIIGKKDEDYFRLRNKPISLANERRILFNEVMESKELKSWEEEIKKTDGSHSFILRHLYPVLNKEEQVKIVIGYGVDITYTKNVLQQIEESEKKYRDVIENSLALITTHDMNGKILTVNQIVGKTYGYRDEELIGHYLTEFMPEKDRTFFNENYLSKIKKDKKQSGIYKVINKSGSITYTLYNNLLKEENGKEPYVVGYAVDITNRVKAEEELKKAQKITEEVAQSKQKFLAHMSHEIRTPMNAIMGMTNQLSKTLLNKDQHYFIEIIQNASSNLLNIINEILDLSKIEAGKLSLEKIAFEPKTVIDQAMQVMMHKAEEKGLLFTNSYCDLNLSEVLIGDPYRLNQILLNLVSNSIKFTDKGTVDISCNIIDENDSQQIIKVTVSDTGKGMDESFTKKLFKKYSQEDDSTARIYGGTGLGMSICEELVHLMDGIISVESKKGEGTSISFIIPFEKGTKSQILVKKAIQLDTNLLKGCRILVADDYEINRLVASTILNNYGIITEEAKNGLEAIEKVEAENFDLILMDVQMPDMDGIEATNYIRDKISKTLPIIALTAYALKGDDAKFIEAGMDDYLSKPFEENQLLEIILKWVKKTDILIPKEIVNQKIAPLFDLTKIQTIAKGNKEFVNKMCALFIDSTPVSILDMKTAYSQNDFEKIKKIAHRIKPSIDNLEISSIKNEIREIEMYAETYQTSEKLENLILKVEKVMTEVVANLNLIL
jgi:PAS domain S-box-containing protein